jgi:hypothetical protein
MLAVVLSRNRLCAMQAVAEVASDRSGRSATCRLNLLDSRYALQAAFASARSHGVEVAVPKSLAAVFDRRAMIDSAALPIK